MSCAVLLAGAVGAQTSQPLARGLAWLQAQVASDGSLQNEAASGALPLQARSETARTLKQLASLPAALADAIAANAEDNTEFLARQAVSQVQAGRSAATLLAALGARQNSDGGFGGAPGFASNALDTAWTMLAFSAGGYADGAARGRAASYLVSQQDAFGSFGVSPGQPSAYVSALALMALQTAGSDPMVLNALNQGAAWLRGQQGADGSWGSVTQTALASLALQGNGSDSGVQSAAQAFLLAQQGSDGAWGGDPYVTALALRAMSGPAAPPSAGSGGKLTLRVVDAGSGQPLGGASVVLPGLAPALSDPTGRATLVDVPAGAYALAVSASGYAAQNFQVTIVAGSTLDGGTVQLSVLPTAGVLKGAVRDGASGAALADAIVTVSGAANASTRTAADGSYLLGGLAPGALNITVTRGGFNNVLAAGSVTAGGTLIFSPAMTATPPGGDPSGTPADTTGSMIGQAVDAASGAPLAGVAVTLAGSAQGAQTGADGRFTIASIPAGSYAVRMSKAGYSERQLPGVMIAAATRTDVQVIPFERVMTSVTVQGTLTDINGGKPIAMATVSVVGSALQARTDAGGNYRIDGLPVSPATLRFSASGYASETVMATFPAAGAYRVDRALALDNGGVPSFSQFGTDRASYGAYAPVTINMAIENKGQQALSNVLVDLLVFDPSGGVVNLQQVMHVDAQGTAQPQFTFPAGSITEADGKWFTQSYAPGQYQVKGRIYLADPATGLRTALAERSASFTIEPSQNIVRLAVAPTPAFSNFDATEQVSYKVEAINHSNQPASTSFRLVFKAPDGTVLNEREATLALQPNEILGGLVVGPFPQHFSAAGVYPVEISWSSGAQPAALVNGQIEVAPGTRVEMQQQVAPTVVTPDGDKRIKIQLQLKGVEQK